MMSEAIIDDKDAILEKDVAEMSDAEILERIIELGFGGEWEFKKRLTRM